MYKMIYALWMTVSGLVLSLVLAKAHSIRFSPRTWLLTNKNTSPPRGAIPQSICEEVVVETESCLDVGEDIESRGWGDGVHKHRGQDICRTSADLLVGAL